MAAKEGKGTERMAKEWQQRMGKQRNGKHGKGMAAEERKASDWTAR